MAPPRVSRGRFLAKPPSNSPTSTTSFPRERSPRSPPSRGTRRASSCTGSAATRRSTRACASSRASSRAATFSSSTTRACAPRGSSDAGRAAGPSSCSCSSPCPRSRRTARAGACWRGRPPSCEPGETLLLADGELEAEPLERLERGTWIVRLAARGGEAVLDAIERVGTMPLPPVHPSRSGRSARGARPRALPDRLRPRARRRGGADRRPALHARAPRARSTRAGIERASLTLHVGPGTFQPVESEDVDAHRMHAERFERAPRDRRGASSAAARAAAACVAVGTTSCARSESAIGADGRARERGAGETRLFLRPGRASSAVDALMTNFHLPRSTLLMLVAAFAGRERIAAPLPRGARAGLPLLQLRRRDAAHAMSLRHPGPVPRSGCTCPKRPENP